MLKLINHNHSGVPSWWEGQELNQESPLERIMKDIIAKEDFKILIKEALKEVLKEIEEERLNKLVRAEFDIHIQRLENGTKV